MSPVSWFEMLQRDESVIQRLHASFGSRYNICLSVGQLSEQKCKIQDADNQNIL